MSSPAATRSKKPSVKAQLENAAKKNAAAMHAIASKDAQPITEIKPAYTQRSGATSLDLSEPAIEPELSEERFSLSRVKEYADRMRERGEVTEFLQMVPISKIDRSKNNRGEIDTSSEEFIKFQAGIKKNGLIQLPTLTLGDSDEFPFRAVCGHRRLMALEAEGIKEHDFTFRLFNSPEEESELQIQENEDREAYSPLDRAEAYFSHQKRFGLSTLDMAKNFKMTRKYMAHILKLAEYPTDVKDIMRREKFTHSACQILAKKSLTVEQLRTEVLKIVNDKHMPRGKKAPPVNKVSKRDQYFAEKGWSEEIQTAVKTFCQDFNLKQFFDASA